MQNKTNKAKPMQQQSKTSRTTHDQNTTLKHTITQTGNRNNPDTTRNWKEHKHNWTKIKQIYTKHNKASTLTWWEHTHTPHTNNETNKMKQTMAGTKQNKLTIVLQTETKPNINIIQMNNNKEI